MMYKNLSICWYQDPRAIYFEGVHKRTYFSWFSLFNQVCVAYFDHGTLVWSDPYVVGKGDVIDDHQNPAILIDSSGYIYVFWTHRQSPGAMFVRKTSSPEDLSTLGSPVTILATGAHYPNPCILPNGDIWVFYRKWTTVGEVTSWNWHRIVSTDGGATWGSDLSIWETSHTAYAKVYVDNIQSANEIHIGLCGIISGTNCPDIGYAWYDVANSQWKKAGGTVLTLPLTWGNSDRVYTTPLEEKDGDLLYDMMLSNGHPCLAWVGTDGDSPRFMDWMFAYYDSGWQVSTITASGGQVGISPYNSGIAIVDDSTVYLSKKVGQFHEIQKWIRDGSNWSKDKDITANSLWNNWRPFMPYNYSTSLALFWQRGWYEHWLNDWDCRLKWSSLR